MPIRNFAEEWIFPKSIEVPGLFQTRIGGSSLVAKTLYQRGFTNLAAALPFLDPELYTPASPDELPGLRHAADRLQKAIHQSDRILIWGDFDVDGQTSTTVLHSGLSELGAQVSYYIPIRKYESHGISIPSLQARIDQFNPDLLLTCDTGIDEVESVDYARQNGLDVIITDHHQLPGELPEATAILNPNLLPEDHPLYHLPGVGVAYKLIEELYTQIGINPSPLLDLVALGIVADIAVQTGDTRYLLQRGLNVLKNSPRPGLLELYKLAGISPQEISEEQIGFVIGPRLNALGRLGDANPSVEFLTTQDAARAHQLAAMLEDLNRRRQDLTEEIYHDALEKLHASPFLVDDFPILVLAGPPSWNPGVIGIVASRLVDRYNKPVIILAEDGELSRGSARSIPGVHISDLIKHSGDLLVSHGGHPMAAGMSLETQNISKFRTSLSNNFHRLVGELPDRIQVGIDAELPFLAIREDLITDLNRLAPFGAGNPKLLFATRGVSVESIRAIGKNESHRKIALADPAGSQEDFLWWNSTDIPIPESPLDVAYTLDLTTYRNQTQIQATIQHLRSSPAAPVYIKEPDQLNIIDKRSSPNPQQELDDLLSSYPGELWAERIFPSGHKIRQRTELQDHSHLIIWTVPPSRYVLTEAIERVQPQEIVLFGQDPSFVKFEDFIHGLLGLIKHLSKTEKSFHLERFAQALAVSQNVIEVGILWIHLQDNIDLSKLIPSITLPRNTFHTSPSFLEIDRKLKQMLREIAAYRKFYLTAPYWTLL